MGKKIENGLLNPLLLRPDFLKLGFDLWKIGTYSSENSKTKAIIFNNPNNPLGKVFQRHEIEEIANLCKKHNVLVISDDVYEHMVFDDNEMIRIATLPDMYERTITVGSAGKTFSVTGWKLGWAIGPEHLLKNCQVNLHL